MMSFLFEVYASLFWPLFVMGIFIGAADHFLDLGLINVPTTADSLMDTVLVPVHPSLPRTKISYELAPLKPTTVLVHLPVLLPTPAFLDRAERKLSVLVCTLLDLLQGSESDSYTHTHTVPKPRATQFGSNLTPGSPYKSHSRFNSHTVPMVPRFPGSYSAYIPLAAN
ncbi:hypothetical protein PENSPDRAFT_101968 [Peniophora sp. CONT]|nr:hypothetical protein PENSPDRAFT_101968 [Peniophora sp. CONT]